MSEPLRVLVVENSESDYAMVIRLLEQGGYATQHARVETAEEMTTALGNAAWDIVLSDYELPAFNAPRALEVLKDQQLDLPFIVISGDVGEETAVEMLNSGAHAYVLKDRPGRLVAAVERELHQAELRREKVKSDAALLASERRYRRLFETAKDGILILDAETGKVDDVNPFLTKLLGIAYEQVQGQYIWDLGVFKDVAASKERFLELQQQEYVRYDDLPLETADGRHVNVEFVSNVYMVDRSKVIQCNIRDISERVKTAQALKESDERYRALTETTSDGFWVVDATGRLLEVNDAYCAMSGYSREQLLGMSILDLKPTETPELFRERIGQMQQVGWARFETQHRRADGSLMDVDVNVAALHSRDQLIAFLTDITESKLAEATLRESEERYRFLFENMLNGFAYCQISSAPGQPPDFTYLAVNQAFETLTGLHDVVGKNVSEVIPGIQQSDPQVLDSYAKVAATGISESLEVFLSALDMWFAITVYSPKQGYFVAVFDVITERKRAEEALQQSEHRLLEAQQTAHIGDWSVDFETNAVHWSPENYHILGLDPERVTASFEAYMERVIPQDLELVKSSIQDAMRSGISDRDIRIVRPDGTLRVINGKINAVLDKSGKATGISGTMQDVTERKQAEEALRDSERRLLDAQHVAHIGDWTWNFESNTLIWSAEHFRIFGMDPRSEPQPYSTFIDSVSPENREFVSSSIQAALHDGKPYDIDFGIMRADGSRREVNAKAHVVADESGKAIAMSGTIQDITERKRAETVLERKNRALKALSASNHVMIHSTDEQSLLDEVCSSFVNVGGYQLAWVGYARHDAERSVELVAAKGSALGYTENIHVTWGEDESGSGPTGTSIRTGQIAIIEDTQTEKGFGEWRAKAAAFGLQSAIAIPFRISPTDIGVLNLYSAKFNTFTADEIELLSELADDLVFGIVTLRARAERHLTEERLSRTQRMHQALLSTIPDLAWLKDEDGRYIAVNQTFADSLSLAPDDFPGKNDYDFFPRELAERYRADEEEIIHTGLTKRVEEPYVGSSGTQIWIETIKVPFLNEEGRVVGTAGIARDMTERMLAERQRLLLSAAIEQTSDALVITDSAGIMQYVNPAYEKLTGYSAAEAVGQTPRLLNSGKQSTEFYQQLWQTIQAGRIWTGRLVNRRKNGQLYQEEQTITPVLDGDKQITNFVAVKRDVTDQVHHELELRQAQKLEAIGRLAAGIAHEINSPMQFVGDNTTYLKEAMDTLLEPVKMFELLTSQLEVGEIDSVTREQALNLAHATDLELLIQEIPPAISQSLEGISRVTDIVLAMKEFSHPGRDEMASINLNRAIESTITIARNEWKLVADVETQLAPDLPELPGYAGEINQVILNLLTNAAQAIAETGDSKHGVKGKITISTAVAGGWIEMRIADTGVGIPENIRDRVFEPFFTTKVVGEGTGQGLAITYAAVVERHRGRISFETAPGKGTTFLVQLPIVAAT